METLIENQAGASEHGIAATTGRRTWHIYRLIVNEDGDLASVDVDIVAHHQSYEQYV